MRLSEHVVDILAGATIEGTVLRLTCGQLDRKTYEAVNKALDALGGKWNRKLGGHVFAEDPSGAIEQALLTGEVTSAKKEFDFFQTPVALAERMAELADVRFARGTRILEPSAGHGRILDAMHKVAGNDALSQCLEIVELNPKNRSFLSEQNPRVLLPHAPCGKEQPIVGIPNSEEK